MQDATFNADIAATADTVTDSIHDMDNFLAEGEDNSKSDHCGKHRSDKVHPLSSYARLCTHISLHTDRGR